MKHIILDLDGTLIDSKKEIERTYRVVFDSIVPERRPDLDKLSYSLTLNDLLKTVYLPEESGKIEAARKLFTSVYDFSDYLETGVYEGVEETLEYLAKAGHKMYIATNKRLSPTRRILEKKGMLDYFLQIMANEMQPGITLSKRQMIAGIKESGGFKDGFMVGDSLSDIKAGKDEGLVTVAANYGYEPAELLATGLPDFGIERFEELVGIVDR